MTADLPDLDAKDLRERLSSKRGFVWLKRDITPEQQREIYRQGLPGIGFLNENKRDYPNGDEVSHLHRPRQYRQSGHRRHREMARRPRARRACTWPASPPTGCKLRCSSRSICASSTRCATSSSRRAQNSTRSPPPASCSMCAPARSSRWCRSPTTIRTIRSEALDPSRINRLTTGVYEMGSTFKAFTVAMALDSGKVTLNSKFDARVPLQMGRFAIHDFDAQHRILSVPEIFTYSSNIGAARIALSLGSRSHKAFLKKLGQLDRLAHRIAGKRRADRAEALERAEHHHHRLRPRPLGRAVAGGDGRRRAHERRHSDPADLPQAHRGRGAKLGQRVIKPETSTMMRYLMRLNVEKGTAAKADVPGYYIGGKTGTADKVVFGRYSKTKVLTDFMAVLPADQPRYLLLIMLDEPHATAGNPRLHHVGLERRADRRRRGRAHRAAPRHRSRAWTCRPPISRYWPR